MTKKEQAFVLAYLLTYDPGVAYMECSNIKNLPEYIAEEGGEMLLRDAEISGLIEGVKDSVRIEVLLEHENNLPMLLTEHDKSAILAEIVRSKMKAYRESAGHSCTKCGMSEYPTHEEILSALEHDCLPCIAKTYRMMMKQRSGG